MPARRARPARAGGAPARAPHTRALAGGGGDPARLAVRLLAALRLRGHLHVRGRHAQRRAPRRRARPRPRPAARAARPGGAARPDRSRRARARWRPTSSGSAIAPGRRTPTSSTTCCARVGDLTANEAQARCLGAVSAKRMLGELEKRAARRANAHRRRGALDRLRGRGALPRRVRRRAARRPAGRLPRGRGRSARPAHPPLRAHPRPVHHRRPQRPLRVDLGPVLQRARARRRAADPGELRPGGSEREWCDSDVLRRLRRASLASLRKEVEPAEQRALARLLPAWQGVDSAPPGRRRRRPPARAAGAASGPGARARGVGARRAPAARRRATRPRGWISSAPAASSCGSAPARSAAARASVALYFREDVRWLGPPPFKGDAPGGAAPRRRSARGWKRAPRSGPTCSPTSARPSRSSSRRRSGTWSGPARSPTTRSRRCAPRA